MGELEAIRVFLAVAEQASFAGAARQLGLTPAKVTRVIARLEDGLGLQLLVRTTRQVALTSAGAVYAARVSPLALALAEAAEETREAQGLTSGHIRISAPLSLGLKVLPSVLPQFAARYPETHIALNLSDNFVDIMDEDYDLAIRVSGPPSDKSTIWRKICEVPIIIVSSPAYLAAKGTPQTPEDLTRHCCLSYSPDATPDVWELSRGPSKRSHKARGLFSANNGDLMARLVMGGQGIAMLPRFIIEEDLKTGKLVQILHEWAPPQAWLTLYYPPYEKLPLRVATFSDFFENHIKQAQPL